MAHPASSKILARNLYIRGKSWSYIATETGVSESTLQGWRKKAKAEGDDWLSERTSRHLAGSGRDALIQTILQDYLEAHAATLTDVKGSDMDPAKKVDALSRLADALTKTLSSLEKSSPKLSKLAVAKEVLEKLVKYISTHHPQAAPVLLEALEPFGERLARDYG
ncbi:MAG: DUF1804 family protein [Magnetococcales bacterium]|nr:DUF1804 family protein [Magnetococcales bacterium]